MLSGDGAVWPCPGLACQRPFVVGAAMVLLQPLSLQLQTKPSCSVVDHVAHAWHAWRQPVLFSTPFCVALLADCVSVDMIMLLPTRSYMVPACRNELLVYTISAVKDVLLELDLFRPSCISMPAVL